MEKLNLDLNITEDEIVDIEYNEPLMSICNKINVYLDSGKVNNYGFSLAMISEVINGNYPEIIVDEYFLLLSDESKKFVLYHEIGHYVKGHLSKYYTFKDSIINFFNDKFKDKLNIDEQEADYYAYTKVGDLDKCMEYFDEIYLACKVQLLDSGDTCQYQLNKLKRDFENRKRLLARNVEEKRFLCSK